MISASLPGMMRPLPDATWQYCLIYCQLMPYSLAMRTDGYLIRRKRIGLGHGLNRFAALAGISGAALSRIETGQRSPRPETLKKITDALGCQIAEVIAEEDGVAPEVQSGAVARNDEAPRGPAGAPQSSTSTLTSK